MQKRWKTVLVLTITTFVLSVFLNLGSNSLLSVFPLTLSFGLLLFIVLIGILFDILGVAATAGDEAPFHAMASNRVAGARQAIWLVRNADRVSAFSNDVVGDIAGTLSGAVGASIVFQIQPASYGINEALFTTIMIAFIASITVGGKALGKGFAISRSVDILYVAGRILYTLEKFGIRLDNSGNKNKHKKR